MTGMFLLQHFLFKTPRHRALKATYVPAKVSTHSAICTVKCDEVVVVQIRIQYSVSTKQLKIISCLECLRSYITMCRDFSVNKLLGGLVAEWLACWTHAQMARVQIAVATLSGNSLRQTVHTHCVSVHQAAKMVATLLRVAGVTAGVAESNGSLPPGL